MKSVERSEIGAQPWIEERAQSAEIRWPPYLGPWAD